jgi:hypothetical protein
MEQLTANQLDPETKEGWIALEVLRVLGYTEQEQEITVGFCIDLPNKSNLQFDWQNNDGQLTCYIICGSGYYVISYGCMDRGTIYRVYDIFGNTKELWQFH